MLPVDCKEFTVHVATALGFLSRMLEVIWCWTCTGADMGGLGDPRDVSSSHCPTVSSGGLCLRHVGGSTRGKPASFTEPERDTQF